MRNTLGVCCENEPRLCKFEKTAIFQSIFAPRQRPTFLPRFIDSGGGSWDLVCSSASRGRSSGGVFPNGDLKPGHGNAFATGITYNPSHCATLRWKYFIHHH